MIIDKDLQFSDKQAITASANGTKAVDLTQVAPGDIGHGERLNVIAHVTTAFTDAASDSTVKVDLVTSDSEDLSNPTVLATVGTFAALTAAGKKLQYTLPVGLTYKRYLGIAYTVANGNLTTGNISTYLSPFTAPTPKVFPKSGIPV